MVAVARAHRYPAVPALAAREPLEVPAQAAVEGLRVEEEAVLSLEF